MKNTLPWSVTGIPPEAREAARAAANREGLSVGDWLTRRILGEAAGTDLGEPEPPRDFLSERTAPLRFAHQRDDDTRRDRDDMVTRLARAEAETDSAFKRIDETLRAMTRRLETAERSQNEAHRAMGVAAAEINQAARDQANAFSQLAERIERVERSADNGAIKDAVRGLHQGLSRLADQIARTANESSTQVASLAANVETVAGKVTETRDEASRAGQSLDGRVATLAERVKLAEEASNGATTALRTALGLFESRLAAAEPKVSEIERNAQAITTIERTMELVTQRLAAAETRASASDDKAQDTLGRQLGAIEKSLAAIVSRLDAGDKQQRDGMSELREGLANTNKRIDALAKPTAPAPVPEPAVETPVAAPILDMPPFNEVAPPVAEAAPVPPPPAPEFATPPPFELAIPAAVYTAETPGFAPPPAPAAFMPEPTPTADAAASYLAAARRAAQAASEAEPQQASHGPLGSFRTWSDSDSSSGMSRTVLIGAAILLLVVAAMAGILFTRGFVRGSSEVAPATQQVGQLFSQSKPAAVSPETNPNAGGTSLPARPLTRGETPQFFGTAAPSLEEAQQAAPQQSVGVNAAEHAPPTTAGPPARGLTRNGATAAPTTLAQTTANPATAPLTADSLMARAKAGDAKAELVLGIKYLDGDGVTASDTEAVNWLKRSAAQGNVLAEYRLGTMFERGRGLPADAKQAHDWYEKAARGGNRKAMHNLAVSFAQGAGADKDYKQAAHWFTAAATLGLLDSQFNLAVLYERGLGVAPSLRDAYKWYAIAAGQGDAESKTRLDALATQLTPEDKQAAEKEAASFRPQPMNRDANDTPNAP